MRKNKHDKTISFRLDDELYNMIVNSARNAGITKGEYIRQQLRKGKVVVKQEVVADFPQIKEVHAELGKIGSNINQIAHFYNGGGSRSREMFDGIQKALADIYAMKLTVEKMGGELSGCTKTHTDKKR